jgi:uncharacterized membrane protein YagU involved in acid resistance
MWGSALVAGLIGGVGMGLLMQDAMPAVASLYGQEGALAGWIAHLFHSAIFALIFAAVVTRGALRPYADTLAKVVGLGAVYGVVLTVVGPGVLMPIWMNAVNPAANAPLFAIGAMSFVTHLVYGLLLGAVFVLARRTGTPGSDESATEGDELRADLAETE